MVAQGWAEEEEVLGSTPVQTKHGRRCASRGRSQDTFMAVVPLSHELGWTLPVLPPSGPETVRGQGIKKQETEFSLPVGVKTFGSAGPANEVLLISSSPLSPLCLVVDSMVVAVYGRLSKSHLRVPHCCSAKPCRSAHVFGEMLHIHALAHVLLTSFTAQLSTISPGRSCHLRSSFTSRPNSSPGKCPLPSQNIWILC